MKNNKFIPYIDVLSEPSINMIRLYLIIRELQYNRNKRLVMTLEKLCFFNAAIVSNDIVNSILIRNKKILESDLPLSMDESLSYKHRDNITEAIQGSLVKGYVIKLSCLNVVDISIANNEKMLSIINSIDINEHDPLISKWKENIHKLKFCINKTERELYSSLIEASYE